MFRLGLHFQALWVQSNEIGKMKEKKVGKQVEENGRRRGFALKNWDTLTF